MLDWKSQIYIKFEEKNNNKSENSQRVVLLFFFFTEIIHLKLVNL